MSLEVGIFCQCGQAFKQVKAFVTHAERCDELFGAMAEDPKLQTIYEDLLHLKRGSLA